MIYLTGASNNRLKLQARELGLGLMAQPGTGYLGHVGYYDSWAADNGCFAKGKDFDPGAWLTWLDDWPRKGCLFAVAPDVVADAEATLKRSAPYLPVLRDMGFPAAYVAQDGFADTPVPWDSFDALFIGGSTHFKLSQAGRDAATEAITRGKWVHVGRVNSYRRLCYAQGIGAKSVDGTFLAFGPDVNLRRLVAWLEALKRPLPLFDHHAVPEVSP